MQKTPTASPKVVPAKLPAANPSMKKSVSADSAGTKLPSSPSKSPSSSALQSPGVPNTRLTPLTPEPVKRTVSELKKPAHAGVTGSPVAAGRASPKLGVSASTPTLHKNTEIAKLPAAKKVPAHVKTDSASSNISVATSSPSASPATPNTTLSSLLPKSPNNGGVEDVFSARTEVALAHEVVRQNREKAASEAAAVEAAAKAEQDAIQAEWERSRKAENDRINAEIARLAKEKEEEEDRKTLAMMEATLASHGIKREPSSVVSKDQAEALAAHRASERLAAEQEKKDLKEARAARRATMNTNLEVSPATDKRASLRSDAAQDADKSSASTTHLPSVSANGSRSHTPQLSESRRLVNSSSNAGDKSPREQQEATTTAAVVAKPASRSPVASNRSSLLPAADSANTLLPPTIKSRSRSGSITSASTEALFNRLSQPSPNHIAAQPASTTVNKSPKQAGFRSIASDSQSSPVAANRASPSSSTPAGSPSVTKSREDEHLESLGNDPRFAALKDKNDAREGRRDRSPSKSRKRRTNGSSGSRSPVQVNSRRGSLTPKEMAMVPGFMKQVQELDSLLEKNRLTGGARTPVLDGSAEASQAVKDILNGTTAKQVEEENVRRKSWSMNLVPACAHEVFEKYKEKLIKCRMTLQEGVEKGNITGVRMNEALAFIRENDRHSAHSQFIFEAGFEAGKAAAREQARLELEAAVKAAKDAAMGITKENAAEAQQQATGPTVDTSDKVLTAQGIVIVESVRSP